jgi:hypothetical protein
VATWSLGEKLVSRGANFVKPATSEWRKTAFFVLYLNSIATHQQITYLLAENNINSFLMGNAK